MLSGIVATEQPSSTSLKMRNTCASEYFLFSRLPTILQESRIEGGPIFGGLAEKKK